MAIILASISALFIGGHQILAKTIAVREAKLNVLVGYLFFITLFAFIFQENLKIDNVFFLFLIIIKSFIILVAWYVNLSALKELSISSISPFRLITPVFALIFALIIFEQAISLNQLLGFVFLVIIYFLFTVDLKKYEPKIFKSKWFYLFVFSMFLHVISILIDKYLLQQMEIFTLLFYFYLFIFGGYLILNIKQKDYQKFKYDKKNIIIIILIAVTLFFGDWAYFSAIKYSDINVGIISIIKQFSIVVAFFFGGLMFKERMTFKKIIMTIGAILSMFLLV